MKIIDVKQGTPEWVRARLGIPTVSRFKNIITPAYLKPCEGKTKNGYMAELLVEWLFGQPYKPERGDSSGFMARGKDMEQEAVDWYQLDRNIEVQRVGFIALDDGSAGCSPDFLVGDDGGGEIKCLGAKAHVMALLGLQVDDYRLQVQGNLWISERHWWDRIFYHPTLPSIVQRVERDEDVIQKLADGVEEFNADLEAAKAQLLDMGCTRVVPSEPEKICMFPCGDNWCLETHDLVQVGNGWLCKEHAEMAA